MKRARPCLLLGVAAALTQAPASGATTPNAATTPYTATTPFRAAAYPAVSPDRALAFPADYGSHPEYRTEWWYVTGWLRTSGGESLGFQVTFFRTRPDIAADNPSAFTPRQLIIAHGAISDPTRGRLWQSQRIRRAGFGLAEAETGDTNVWIDQWRLRRDADGYTAAVVGEDFSFDLRFAVTQAPMLNGHAGVSRKGPQPQAASYYYSLPHLQVSGTTARAGRGEPVSGEAWLDHEWSSEYLDAEAVGWDWIGVNMDDGGALMAFRIRGAQDQTYWSGGTLRNADGTIRAFEPNEVSFTPGRTWVSPRTAVRYPVEWRVRAGSREFELLPLMDDQENDTRLSTGAIYWEGAVRTLEHGRAAGRGYLELTGYGERLRLR